MQARAFRQANGEIAPRRHRVIAQPIRPPFLLGRKRHIGFHHRHARLIDQVEGRIAGGAGGRATLRRRGLRASLRRWRLARLPPFKRHFRHGT